MTHSSGLNRSQNPSDLLPSSTLKSNQARRQLPLLRHCDICPQLTSSGAPRAIFDVAIRLRQACDIRDRLAFGTARRSSPNLRSINRIVNKFLGYFLTVVALQVRHLCVISVKRALDPPWPLSVTTRSKQPSCRPLLAQYPVAAQHVPVHPTYKVTDGND
jgi:hypothetical protein